MKKLFTLAAAVLASISLTWAVDYYTPTAEEVVEVAVTGPAIATHAAIGNASETYTAESGKTCCDPSDVSKTKSQFALDLKDGNVKKTLVLNIAGCDSICLYCDRNDRGIKAVLTPSKGEPETIYGQIGLRYTGFKLDPNKSYSITFTGVGSDKKGADVRVAAVRLIPGETCTDPEAVLTFNKSTAYVGDQFSYNYSSKNGGALNDSYTLNGDPAVQGTDYTFSSGNITVLNAGQFVMHRTIDAQDGYCAVDVSDTILINEKTPVASVTVAGPTTAYKGNEVSYTATAGGATEYRWKVNGAIQAGAEAAEFKFTPTVNGAYSIVCEARNSFNASEEWIPSDPISLKVTSLYGEIIAVTRNEKVLNDVTGIVGGTAKKSTQDNGKLGSTGHYWSLTLANGNFQSGDTVIVNVSAAAQQGTITVTSDQAATDALGTTEDFGVVGDNKIVLTKGNVNTIWVVRTDANKWNGVIDGIRVVRPMDVKSTVETLTGVTINDVAIESSDLTKLVSTGEVILEDAYVNAPVVKFTKHTVITFEDESTKESDDVIEKTSSQATASTWGATATIGGNAYTVYTVKSMSYVVTYKFGEETLGSENVEANGTPAKYADYQKLDDGGLSTFVDWYNDADLAEEHKVADIAAAVITEATTFYAKFDYKYSESINIEKWVMENGAGKGKGDKTTEFISFMGSKKYAKGFAWESGNLELDSLDNSKSDKLRNYAYLGLKVKKSGSQFRVRLAPSSTVKIKFGAYKTGSEPTVSINGGEKAPITIENNVYSYTATGEDLLTFNMKTADAVVLQQIAINEELADPALFAINCAAVENGTLAAAYKLGIPGETIALTVTPAGGYVVASVSVNSDPIAADGEGKYSFEMPAAVANVAATFSVATAIDNNEAAVKAVKMIENGQLYIMYNGTKYNVQGNVVR